MTGTAAGLIKIAKSQVGVHESKSGGQWTNGQKYSEELPGFAWSDHQPWCDTFAGWCAWKAGLTETEFPRSASCDNSGDAWAKMHRWSEYPAVGAQVFFGTPSDLQHTGIVTAYDGTYIHTVEGNTNSTGSYQGDGVYAKTHERRDARVIGYGYPKFSHPIDSADPKWSTAPSPQPSSQRLVFDYSFERPDPKPFPNAGFVGVMRYISNGSQKDLTVAEAKRLHDAGLWIGLVWESTAGRAGEGAAAGQADVRAAEAAADQLGYPENAVIFYAVDFDATPRQVRPYFKAVKAGAKRPVGIYGGYKVVNALIRLAEYAWQTEAWSSGKVSRRATMLQRARRTVSVGDIGGWDQNELRGARPWRAWRPGSKPAPDPKPTPDPTPDPTPTDPTPKTGTVGVLSWNVGDGHDSTKVTDLIELSTHAHLIGLQEASDRADAVSTFTTAHPMWDSFAGSSTGAPAVPSLYRVDQFKLISAQAVLCVPARNVGKEGAGPTISKPKYATVLHLEHLRTGLHVQHINTHFIPSAADTKLPADERKKRTKHYTDHVAALVKIIDGIPADQLVILTGDFNASPSFRLLKPLHDLGMVGWQTVGTHGRSKYDNVLTRGAVVSRKVEVYKTSSDHLAAGAVLKVSG